MLHTLADQIPRFFGYYNLVFLLQATFTTVALSVAGCVCGFVFGFLIAVLRQTGSLGWLPMRGIGILFVEMFRRIPFLVTLFLVFYLFQVLNVDVSVFWVAVASTCVIGAAFLSEVVRGGFESVPRQEWEAAEAMNFNLYLTLRYVVVPQSWKVILPPAFAFFLSFVKDSALASQIGVIELTYAAKTLNNKGFSPLLGFGMVLILYFIISYPLTRLGAWMETHLALSRNR
jgi:polar amino acid transport system permease protein